MEKSPRRGDLHWLFGTSSPSREDVVQREPGLVPLLRSGTKLAFACGETSSHSVVLGVEL
jgi:hypothetical protein